MKAKWFLILLIASISFTGFATTSDLTQDSVLEFSNDVDVGIDALIVVNVVNEEIYLQNSFSGEPLFVIRDIMQPGFRITILRNVDVYKNYKPPLKTTFKNNTLNYKRARDGLDLQSV